MKLYKWTTYFLLGTLTLVILLYLFQVISLEGLILLGGGSGYFLYKIYSKLERTKKFKDIVRQAITYNVKSPEAKTLISLAKKEFSFAHAAVIRHLQLIRQRLDIALTSKKRDTAEGSMKDVLQWYDELFNPPEGQEYLFTLLDDEDRAFIRSIVEPQIKQYHTSLYINVASDFLEKASKRKSIKIKNKYWYIACKNIIKGMEDNQSNKKILQNTLCKIPKHLSLTPIEDLDLFRQEAKKYGHPDYPFLSKDYSPDSRVPSVELSPFIIEHIKRKDIKPIIALMKEILSANPGLGVDTSWIDPVIRKIMRLDFGQYLGFSDPNAYIELKALWIIASKYTDNPNFWITTELPKLFSWALCCHFPMVHNSISKLVEKANNFISKMAEEIPYWKEYPKFSIDKLIITPPEINSTCIGKIKNLSLSSRMHLFFAFKKGGGNLINLINYAIRNFGISVQDSASQIIKSELFVPSSDPKLLSTMMTQKELLNLCREAGIEVRKSWNKNKLIDSLKVGNPEYCNMLIKKMNLYAPNSKYASELSLLDDYSTRLIEVFKVLCFIN